jgi:hypothetical protein
MAWDGSYSEDAERSVLRHHNRALRAVSRKQREALRILRHEKDYVYKAFTETETEAERAMRELWESGEFICGPQDYDFIVARVLEAFRYLAIPHEPHRR